MGLRKDFLIHKGKTVGSFRFVRADISSINNQLNNIKNQLFSMESRISMINSELLNLQKAIDKNASEISIQQNHNINIQSKIENTSKSISNSIEAINSLNKGINSMLSKQHEASKKILSHEASIKKLFALSKNNSITNKQLNSALRKSQKEVKRIRNFINQKLKIVSRKTIIKPPKKTLKKKKISKVKAPKKIVTETTKRTI